MSIAKKQFGIWKILLLIMQFGFVAAISVYAISIVAQSEDIIRVIVERRFRFLNLIVGFSGFGGALLLSYFRWFFILKKMGVQVSLRNTVKSAAWSDLIGNFSFGILGADLGRSFFLMKQSPSSKSAVAIAVLFDRAIGLNSLLLLGCFGMLMLQGFRDQVSGLMKMSNQETTSHVIQHDHEPDMTSENKSSHSAKDSILQEVPHAGRLVRYPWKIIFVVMSAFCLAGFTFLGMAVFGAGNEKLQRFVSRVPFVGEKLQKIAYTTHQLSGKLELILKTVVISLAVHTLMGTSFFFAGTGLGLRVPEVPVFLAIYPMVTLLGIIPLPAGGLGLNEVSLDYLIQRSSELQMGEFPQGTGVIIGLAARCFCLVALAIMSLTPTRDIKVVDSDIIKDGNNTG